MPYDPTPMGDDYYRSIQWDERGNPYQLTASGKRSYITPTAAATAHTDDPVGARLAAWANGKGSTYDQPGAGVPQGGFFHGTGSWNGEEGQYKQPINWGNIASLAIGGAIGAPLAAGALAGAGGGAASGAGAGAAIPTTMGIGSATSLGLPATAGLGSAGAAGAAAGAGAAALPSSTWAPSYAAMPSGAATGSGGAAAGAAGAADVLPSSGYSWANGALPGYNTVPNATRLVTAGSSALGSGAGTGAGVGGGAATTAAGLTKGDYAGVGVNAAGSLLSSYFGAKNANEQAGLTRQAALDLQHNDLAASTAKDTQSLAGRESELDPFRNQMSQAKDIGQLDRLERASYAPVKLGMPSGSPYAKYMPQTSGGYSYEKSPELMASASALKKNVMGGNTAPSMTNPDNYGKTGAMDILGVMAGKKDPTSSSSFSTGAPAPGSSLGADPVAGMIRNGYQSALGRPASDEDIRSTIGQLSRTYGRQITAADSGLVQDWIQRNLRTSPEAQARQSSGGYTPSYMNAA